MATWRLAGLNYINYSNIAAKTLRHSLKADLRADAVKRDESIVKFIFWVGGQPLPPGEMPAGSISAGKAKT